MSLSIKVEEREHVRILEPTMQLRWLRNKYFYCYDKNDRPVYNKFLQQMWIDKSDGYTEWRDVEIIINED